MKYYRCTWWSISGGGKLLDWAAGMGAGRKIDADDNVEFAP